MRAYKQFTVKHYTEIYTMKKAEKKGCGKHIG